MNPSEKIRAIVRPSTKQVGCVIIQAVLGGDRRVCQLFDNWAVAPADDMGFAELTVSQWKSLAEKWNAAQPHPLADMMRLAEKHVAEEARLRMEDA